MIYFEKSQPAPECLAEEFLKANGDYKCGCVVQRLKADFKNKCYLCEDNQPTSINVEHLKSHHSGKFKDLKIDWNNLFWSCHHCNMIKSTKYDDILNCTDLADDVENQLRYECQCFPSAKPVISAIDKDNLKAVNAQKLLDAIFNGENTGLKESESYNLRKRLLREIKNFRDLLFEYDDALDEEDKAFTLRKIKSHLNKSSAFTSFKRQIIKDNSALFAQFGDYLHG